MLYVFYGENTDGAREKARGFVDSLLAKREGSLLFRITPDTWSETLVEEYLGGQGLFVQKYIVWLDGLLDDKEIREKVRNFLSEMKTSQNIFVILEKKFDAATLKEVKKHAEKILEVAETNASGGKKAWSVGDFSIFSLADALGEKDKKKLWVLYREAIDRGIPPEEIVGTLFWQVKMIILAHVAPTAAEAGVKDFPFNKAKRYAKNYSLGEAQKLSSTLVSLYHDAHRGKIDFEIGLEKFLLEI